MKKIILGLLCIAVCFASTMSCDIPESVTIKATPEVRVSLNPFDLLGPDDPKITDYLSLAKIREMMGEQGSDGKVVNVYKYKDPANTGKGQTQTYLVHYPIDTIEVDFEEKITEAIDQEHEAAVAQIPSVISTINETEFNTQYPTGAYLDGNATPLTSEGSPLFFISLADMVKMIKVVNGGPFGFKIASDSDTQDLKDHIEVRIPAFGMNDYVKGIDQPDGSIWFYDHAYPDTTPTTTKFWPHGDPEDMSPNKAQLNDKDELEIYVKVTGPCSGKILLDLVIEWESVTLDTTDYQEDLQGEYPITYSLGSFLGEGAEIKTVKGYIYVDGMELTEANGEAKLSLTVDTIPLDDFTTSKNLQDSTRPDFLDLENPPETITATLPEHSLSTPSFIDLTEILNKGAETTLGYEIEINEVTLYAGESTRRTITIDLVILLPLEFAISATSSEDGYVKLDMGGDIFPTPEGNEDLFKREGKDNDILKQLESVKFHLKKYTSNIISQDNFAIQVTAPYDDGRPPLNGIFKLAAGSEPLTITIADLPYPFVPRYEILLRKDEGENFATFKILQPDGDDELEVFEFSLAVEAKADINHTF